MKYKEIYRQVQRIIWTGKMYHRSTTITPGMLEIYNVQKPQMERRCSKMYMHEKICSHGGPGTTYPSPLLRVGVSREHLDRPLGC